MALVSPSGGSGAVSGVVVSGTAASGQVPVASSSSAGAWAYPPGYEFGYDQITTASINVTSVTEATGTTIISCASHTFDGAAVMLEVYFPEVDPNIATSLVVNLFESTTNLGRIGAWQFVANTQACGPMRFRFTPTAAAHTYTITGFVGNATGVAILSGAAGSATIVPSFARFTKV